MFTTTHLFRTAITLALTVCCSALCALPAVAAPNNVPASPAVSAARSAMIDPNGRSAMIDPNGRSAMIDPNGRSAMIDPNG